MPIAAGGMLMTSMDVEEADEAEFNAWYDREHLAARVAIEGFLEARRYVADEASPKYLCLYGTATFAAHDSPAYRQALAGQTARSKLNISRFRNMGRAIARVSASRGQGRGAALGLLRLRPHPAAAADGLRARLADALDPDGLPGIVSTHLLESDPSLSVSLTEPDRADPGAGDWYVLVDATSLEALASAGLERFERAAGSDAATVSQGTFRLMWDLAKADL